MATIKEVRAADAKRKAEQAKADAAAAAEIAAIRARGEKPEEEDDDESLLDKIRRLLSPEERAGSDAIAALQSGVDEADAVAADKAKRKKKK